MSPHTMLGNNNTNHEPERKPFEIKMRYKRQTLQDMTRPLKGWLYKHRDNPYPTKAEKMVLATDSQMTLTQVSNWFANARRRLKNTVTDPDLSWGKRVKMYNSCVKGNQELLSISSDDSAWESGDDHPASMDTSPPHLHHINTHSPSSSNLALGSSQDGFTTSTPCSTTSAGPQLQMAQPQVALPPWSLPPSSTASPLPSPVSWPQHQQQPLNLSHQPEKAQPQQISSQPQSTQQVMTSQPPAQQLMTSQPASTQQAMTSPQQVMTSAQQVMTSPQQVMTSPPPSLTNQSMFSQQHRDNDEQFRTIQYPPAALNKSDSFNSSRHPPVDEQPSKFKNSILQRYLQDSYQHTLALTSPPLDGSSSRHRHASGSLSSHDFEDVSVSSRSTPTKELPHDDHSADYEELYRQWPQMENRAADDLHYKEISAALALTALSRGDFRSNSSAQM